MEKIKNRLSFIYEDQDVEPYVSRIVAAIEETKRKPLRKRKQLWDEEDVVLITYGDQFREEGRPALQSLEKMVDEHLSDSFNIVHILPFYPYSSDDGFSVIDYRAVDPALGSWEDIRRLSGSVRLMFDDVCNHISAESEWFREYLKGNPAYREFFIEMDPSVDLSAVTRPRAHPLLTAFTTADGEEKHIWTTFSSDQIDLNFGNPEVLVRMAELLLFYIEQGAEFIRLDAVGFVWKEVGTPSIHHPKTHEIVKLFRDIADEASPGTVLITETNVPHEDNISYFGNGHDEAHMVYQFPLPPLVLYSIHNGNGSALTKWAKGLPDTGGETAFYNFLASHDGIGLNPIRGIVPENEITDLVGSLQEEGALVSYKRTEDGREIPYEINVTYFDALSRKQEGDEARIAKFLLAHSILLTLPGVPAVYVQSILGSGNDYAGVEATGSNRSINRQKFDYDRLESELLADGSVRNRIFTGLKKIIGIRKNEPLFHPNNRMEVEDFGESVFAYSRIDKSGSRLLVLNNLTGRKVNAGVSGSFLDVVTGEKVEAPGGLDLVPYGFRWLKPIKKGEELR
ncbi:alpha-amylase family glycosyl hydrolase [Indiicoccus explosivorum]|uniref:alpha-amylase family glycosyl hydrolase n=1 Tax=Indiicoccus explosivorum TaxID=1917864 RepID=UPI000B435ED4|nr:alpha-amylase family glycosyl hydrolase [Indiicoccus explosivorum]